jgi:hypothetical protein
VSDIYKISVSTTRNIFTQRTGCIISRPLKETCIISVINRDSEFSLRHSRPQASSTPCSWPYEVRRTVGSWRWSAASTQPSLRNLATNRLGSTSAPLETFKADLYLNHLPISHFPFSHHPIVLPFMLDQDPDCLFRYPFQPSLSTPHRTAAL